MQVERWLRKKFNSMGNTRNTLVQNSIVTSNDLFLIKKKKYSVLHILFYSVTLKEVKSFLPRVHCKMSTSKLRELFQEVDTRKHSDQLSNGLSFDEFVTLYNKLIYDSDV